MNPPSPPCAATKLVRRPCCRTGIASYIEPPDIERSMSATFGRDPLPIIEELDEPPIEERTAWHESGHAVVGHALGYTLDMVTVRAPARVVYSPVHDAPALHEIARSHAGPVGEMARLQFWSSGWPEDADEYLQRVHTFQFGGCDHCQMAVAAWRSVGINSPIDEARKVMLEGQALALTIGQRRDVRSAIRALAAALMEQHTIAGPDAHAIIENYVKFGELKNAEEDQKAD